MVNCLAVILPKASVRKDRNSLISRAHEGYPASLSSNRSYSLIGLVGDLYIHSE